MVTDGAAGPSARSRSHSPADAVLRENNAAANKPAASKANGKRSRSAPAAPKKAPRKSKKHQGPAAEASATIYRADTHQKLATVLYISLWSHNDAAQLLM